MLLIRNNANCIALETPTAYKNKKKKGINFISDEHFREYLFRESASGKTRAKGGKRRGEGGRRREGDREDWTKCNRRRYELSAHTYNRKNSKSSFSRAAPRVCRFN